MFQLRQKIGAAVLDWPRFEVNLRRDWVRVCNRNDQFSCAPYGPGVKCEWKWTSDLHVTKVFPALSGRLLRKALTMWPIKFAEAPAPCHQTPRVSFVIGHRGADRSRLLLATLRTIAAQRDVAIECIVVEQSDCPELKGQLPPWVCHVQTPPPRPHMPYCRAWALNVGARLARGGILVLHDNDMLVPESLCVELCARFDEGYEVMNLKRFIFYLSKMDTESLICSGSACGGLLPEVVMQNLEGGGSAAIGREAFLRIGGFDESFVGWGGEDNEFWERAHATRVWSYGYLPVVHLWHPTQSGKLDASNPNLALYQTRSAIPIEERVRELAGRAFGHPLRPST